MTIVKSVYYDQSEILRGISELYCPNGFECDITYGKGSFYRDIESLKPSIRFDIDPQADDVMKACSTNLPLPNSSFENVVFDPPFLTYVRAGRQGIGDMIMAKQFSGYWRYDELEKHYRDTLKETARILKTGGVLVFKCQDIIHNHKMHCTHANVITWASEHGFCLLDLFVLTAKHRLQSPNRKGKQKHARIFHSYFLVFRREKCTPLK